MAEVYESHEARVTKTDDPDQRGRLKVTCPGITGDQDTELPQWLEPTLDWGWFYVPDIGELIEIEARSHADTDESWGQASIQNADLRWRGKRFYSPLAQEPLDVRPDFQEHYGKQRGFCTPHGHVMVFDDMEPSFYLTIPTSPVKSTATPADSKRTKVTIKADGTVLIESLDKDKIELAPGSHQLTASLEGAKHVLTLGPNLCEVKLDSGASLKLQGKDALAKATVGDGAMSVAIAEHLQELYTQLKAVIDAAAAILASAGGNITGAANDPVMLALLPTAAGLFNTAGASLASLGVAMLAPPYLPTINSTKVKIPDL